MSELMRDFIRTTREGHQMFMEEVHSLIDLQKEQRIDIMALFEGNKHVRIMLEGPYDDPM
jgi:hypothetical protein